VLPSLHRHHGSLLNGPANLTYGVVQILGYIIQNFGIDLFQGIAIFTGIYTSIIYSTCTSLRYSGYLLCAFNVFKVIKYRFYDDIFVRTLEEGGSYVDSPSNPSITLFQGLFNVLLRAYLLVAVSFGCSYVLLLKNTYDRSGNLFYFSRESGNILVDLIYFSVVTMSTVGFGDISPVGVIPKLLSILEIMFGYFFIGVILTLITGRLGKAHMQERL